MMDTDLSVSARLDPLIHPHPLHLWICLFFFSGSLGTRQNFLRVSLWGVNLILCLFFFGQEADIMSSVVFSYLAESLEHRILQFPFLWLPGA